MTKDFPKTTLYMISSVDGKISTGDNDKLDVDKDFPRIVGIKEGLQQYYDIEKTTDFWSLNTGRVMAKIGMNEKKDEPQKIDVLRFVLIDNNPHLKESGIRYLSKKLKDLYIVTTNAKHPAFKLSDLGNVHVIFYKNKINFKDLFAKLKSSYGAESITIQSGGTLNAILLREGLIDYLSLVIAPVLIGGKDTSSLIDGESLHKQSDLKNIKALKLLNCEVLKNSYLHVKYQVIKDTEIQEPRK
jgi:2,5-diamino-6-(ribosylamino)-4(3H)-pyrimidinone 5'-phosphate reductase